MPKKRTDGRYEIKVNISRKGEKPKYRSAYGETLKEARAKAEKIRLESQNQSGWKDYTVRQAIEYWLEQKEKTLRPQSVANYKAALRYPLATLGDMPLADVTIDDARNLHEKVSRQSVLQANRMSARMYSVYQDAILRGAAHFNPFQHVKPYKHEQAEKRALTQKELDAIDHADLNPWERAFISVLRYTGMRKGEALALNVDDINIYEKCIKISKNNVDGNIGPTKTKASERIIPMPDILAKILTEYLAEYHTGQGLLFTNLHGEPIGDHIFFKRWWAMAQKIYAGHAPNDFTAHIFRHTYASELVRNKVPPTTAMLLLGHKSLATTMGVYTHLGYTDIDTSQINAIFR